MRALNLNPRDSGELSAEGNPLALVSFFGMLAIEEPAFEIVRP